MDGTLTIVRTWKATDECGNITNKNQTITINPLPTITASPATQTILYGESITPIVITSTYSEILAPSLPTGFAYDVANHKLTATNPAAGNYTITVTAESNLTPNCGTTSTDVTVEVKNDNKPIVISSDNNTWVYDGTAHSQETYAVTYDGTAVTDVDVTGKVFTLPSGDKVTISNPASIINVSETADHNNTYNYVIEHASYYTNVTANYGKLTITPKAVTLASGSKTREYNGTVLTNAEVEGTNTNGLTTESGWVGTEGATYSFSGSQLTAGESANAFTYSLKTGTAATNYTIAKTEGTLKITVKAVTVTADNATKVYDGTPLTKDSYTNAALASTDHIESVTVTGSQTVVGTSANVPSAAVIKNADGADVTASYAVTYANDTLTVTPKAVTVTADNATKVYDGTPLTKDSYTNTALASTDHIESVTVTGSQTVVGTSDNVPSAAVIKNADGADVTSSYDISYVNGTLEVTKRPFTLTLDSSKVYDGSAFTVTANQLHVSGLADGDVLASGTMWTESAEMGEYENQDGSFQATLAAGVIYKSGFSILDPSSTDVTFCYTPTFKVKLGITPRALTITAASDTKAYDGTPLTNSGYSITAGALASTDNLTSCVVTGSQLCLGSNNNVPSAAVIMNGSTDVTSNYTIHYVNGTLTVTEATGFSCPPMETFYVNDCVSSMTVTLAGTPTVTGIAAGHYTVTNNLSTKNPLTVGTHTITWTLLDDCDKVVATCDQTVKVDYKPCVGVTWQGHTYDAVRIGSQCWFTENLRWATGNHAVYNGDASNVDKFGYLYSWYTAVGVDEDDDSAIPTTKFDNCGNPYVQGICPDGWGIGSLADHNLLNITAGSTSALKEMSTLYWLSGYEGTMPNTGFKARGSGWYNSALARYEDLMTGYHFWQSDATPGSAVFSNTISYYCDEILSTQSRKSDKMSVRCVRKVAP